MGKTLSNILTVFKVVRIIAKVVFILCIVGAAGCLLGCLALPMVSALLESGLLEEGMSVSLSYAACIVGAVVCAGEAVFAFMAEKYFKNVVSAGTPFTFDGAKECFRLGIASLIISVAVGIAAGIASGIVMLIAGVEEAGADFNVSVSVSTGLVFMFLSLIFKHGAELRMDAFERTAQAEEHADQGETL